MYYYGARYYDSHISRFISEDPAGINLSDIRSFTNPQGWNMYSYALNNPVKYTDPSGNEWYDPTTWDWQGIGNSFLSALDASPITGDISDAYASHTGQTLFTGEVLSNEDLDMIKAAATLPILTGGQMRTGKKVTNAIDDAISGGKKVVNNLNSNLKIIQGNRNRGLIHIMERHSFGTSAQEVSIFSKGMGEKEISGLINEAINSGRGTWVDSIQVEGHKIMDIDMGRTIGTGRYGQETSWLKIVKDPNNDLKTAYPITP